MSKQKIKLVPNKAIKKKGYENKYEYNFDRKTNLVPKKENRLLCVLFSEDKGAYFLYRKFDKNSDSFRFNRGIYIIENESIHIANNGQRVAFYLEGVSTPLSMKNVEKYTEDVSYIDLDGTLQKTTVQKIKGLKYDSKILDIFTDRKLSENFTKIDEKFKYGLVTLILVIVVLVLVICGIAIGHYYPSG
jgi:hypothetical protein